MGAGLPGCWGVRSERRSREPVLGTRPLESSPRAPRAGRHPLRRGGPHAVAGAGGNAGLHQIPPYYRSAPRGRPSALRGRGASLAPYLGDVDLVPVLALGSGVLRVVFLGLVDGDGDAIFRYDLRNPRVRGRAAARGARERRTLSSLEPSPRDQRTVLRKCVSPKPSTCAGAGAGSRGGGGFARARALGFAARRRRARSPMSAQACLRDRLNQRARTVASPRLRRAPRRTSGARDGRRSRGRAEGRGEGRRRRDALVARRCASQYLSTQASTERRRLSSSAPRRFRRSRARSFEVL